jgi:hypothetical protein
MKLNLCYWLRKKGDNDMMEKLIEIGRCSGMEMNVGKIILMGISRQSFPVIIMITKITRYCGIF